MPVVVRTQALSLYRDASDLCRRALKRRPLSADDVTFFEDSSSLVSSRVKLIEDALVATVERHVLAKNGLTTARCLATNEGTDDGGQWLRTVLSRCSETSTARTDLEYVPTTDAASLSSSSTSSLAGTG